MGYPHLWKPPYVISQNVGWWNASSAAQGGGGSFKDTSIIGKVKVLSVDDGVTGGWSVDVWLPRSVDLFDEFMYSSSFRFVSLFAYLPICLSMHVVYLSSYLLSSHFFSSLTPPTSAATSVDIVGSLTSNLPSNTVTIGGKIIVDAETIISCGKIRIPGGKQIAMFTITISVELDLYLYIYVIYIYICDIYIYDIPKCRCEFDPYLEHI